MQITLDVRRFFCDFVGCDARTFAEQISGLTKPYARRSTVLHGSLTQIGLALAGRAGARLSATMGMTASKNTLLR